MNVAEEQTPEYILQTYPHLETVHQQFWPEDTRMSTKLWAQAAKLQRTADFLAATGLRISHGYHIEHGRRRRILIRLSETPLCSQVRIQQTLMTIQNCVKKRNL